MYQRSSCEVNFLLLKNRRQPIKFLFPNSSSFNGFSLSKIKHDLSESQQASALEIISLLFLHKDILLFELLFCLHDSH